MALRFADRVLGFANSNVYDELCELVWITRSFAHESSMPLFTRFRETETLPNLQNVVATVNLNVFRGSRNKYGGPKAFFDTWNV